MKVHIHHLACVGIALVSGFYGHWAIESVYWHQISDAVTFTALSVIFALFAIGLRIDE